MMLESNNELSERELEILRLVATGASNKEIAQQLFISANTVKVHLRNIFAKIGAASRTEAALYAVRMRIVERAEQVDSLIGPENQAALVEKPTRSQIRRNNALWAAAGVLLITAVLFLVIGPLDGTSSRGINSPASMFTPTPPPGWRALADMPTPRSGLAVVAYENFIYALAGKTTEAATGILERFDPDSNTWEQLSPKPLAVSQVSAAIVGGLIYIPGGQNDNFGLTTALEVYDPRQDAWSQRAALPVAISSYALVAYEGRLYLFGGWDGEEYLDTVYQYDPSLDSWTELTAMPTRRADMGAAVVGGRIYVIGGYNEQGAVGVNEIYQPDREDEAGSAWFNGQEMPEGRYGMGVASLADIIQVIGGSNDSGTKSRPLAYFPQSDQWQFLDELVYPQGVYLGLVPLGVNLYSLGGQIDQLPSGQNLAYQLLYSISIPVIVK